MGMADGEWGNKMRWIGSCGGVVEGKAVVGNGAVGWRVSAGTANGGADGGRDGATGAGLVEAEMRP